MSYFIPRAISTVILFFFNCNAAILLHLLKCNHKGKYNYEPKYTYENNIVASIK